MAAFPLTDIGRVYAHPAKGISWSKSQIIIKRLAWPKGAVPPHLKSYAEKFARVASECRSAMAGKTGAEKVRAFNACIAARMKK